MINKLKNFDVIIIGAGASGLMCGISAGKRGKRVLIIDHSEKVGRKILISGGGKCNFTNYNLEPENYICRNPHFVKSALSRFSQWDFLEMVNSYGIPFEERTYGQLFCKQSSKDILNMLLRECEKAGVKFQMSTQIRQIEKKDQYIVETDKGNFSADSLVIATGGISWQSAGATNFGYKMAEQFGLKIMPQKAGLVPLILSKNQQKTWSELSGISVNVKMEYKDSVFQDELLFTHKGISGPVVLQISNYWQKGKLIFVDFLPKENLKEIIINSKSKQNLKNFMKYFLPERLVKIIISDKITDKSIYQYNEKELDSIVDRFHHYKLIPDRKGSLDKAEVTLGGIDTDEISSKTFEEKKIEGLFFIGEVLDVTGWLGGYNLQWAWSSGWCAGMFV